MTPSGIEPVTCRFVATVRPNRNECQEYFLGGKGGRCSVLSNLPIHVLSILKSGRLKLLDLSGPVQARRGIALSLPLPGRRFFDGIRRELTCFLLLFRTFKFAKRWQRL
jgi:hypothetical protein